MATSQDAELILKLYELRREEKMRKARDFVFSPEFMPETVDDVMAVFANPEKSAYVRMVVSYWDMAAAMVNHGSIDAELFYDTNGEYFGVWAKIGHLIPELRERISPRFLKNLEVLIQKHPDSAQALERMKAMFRNMAAQAAAAQK